MSRLVISEKLTFRKVNLVTLTKAIIDTTDVHELLRVTIAQHANKEWLGKLRIKAGRDKVTRNVAMHPAHIRAKSAVWLSSTNQRVIQPKTRLAHAVTVGTNDVFDQQAAIVEVIQTFPIGVTKISVHVWITRKYIRPLFNGLEYTSTPVRFRKKRSDWFWINILPEIGQSANRFVLRNRLL